MYCPATELQQVNVQVDLGKRIKACNGGISVAPLAPTLSPSQHIIFLPIPISALFLPFILYYPPLPASLLHCFTSMDGKPSTSGAWTITIT